MPTYSFVCKECRKSFTRTMTLAEHAKGGIVCSHCKSKKVEQKPAAFYAVSAKKS